VIDDMTGGLDASAHIVFLWNFPARAAQFSSVNLRKRFQNTQNFQALFCRCLGLELWRRNCTELKGSGVVALLAHLTVLFFNA